MDVANRNQCPSEENLSLFIDDPTDFEILEHLENCPKCREMVEEYSLVNELVGEISRPAADFGERLLQNLRQRRQRGKFSLFMDRIHPALHWSAAAALVVLAGISAVRLFPSASKSQAEVATVTQNAPLIQPGDVYSLKDLTKLQGDISNVALRNVSVAPSLPTRTIAVRNQEAIPSNTEHIWLVSNMDDAIATVEQIAKTTGCQAIWRGANNDNSAVVTLPVTDVQSQSIADCLYAQHWHLVSPQLPQPGQANNVAFANSKVNYTLRLLKNE